MGVRSPQKAAGQGQYHYFKVQEFRHAGAPHQVCCHELLLVPIELHDAAGGRASDLGAHVSLMHGTLTMLGNDS